MALALGESSAPSSPSHTHREGSVWLEEVLLHLPEVINLLVTGSGEGRGFFPL